MILLILYIFIIIIIFNIYCRYAKQCELFLQRRLISYSLFATDCLPSLLKLSNDIVPNVRLIVARTLHSSLSDISEYS